MPRRRNRRRGKRRRARTSPGRLIVGAVAPPLISLSEVLRSTSELKSERKETKHGPDDTFELVRGASPYQDLPLVGLKALRSLFKADNPYRTKVGLAGVYATNGSGVLNYAASLSQIVSAAEWSSIIILFDEMFVHSMEVVVKPVNDLGAGTGAYTVAGTMTTGTMNTGTGTAALTFSNAGTVWVAVFNQTSTYTTSQSMLDNPTLKFGHTGRSQRYVWRNNVRFDPRGICIPGGTSAGWALTANAGSLPGFAQCRALDDPAIGDASHTVIMGHTAIIWEVSFRQRL